MRLTPIYAALLTSFAGISAAYAATVTQDIAINYGATNIIPSQQCLNNNPNGASNFCIANINPEGLTLKPGQQIKVTTPVSFPAMSWWDEMSPSAVKLHGTDESRSECSSLGNNQWSCILPNSGFHPSGLRVEIHTEGWRAGWGGDLTIDDLVPDAPEIENASATFEPAKDEKLIRNGKMWLATETPIEVTLDFDLVKGNASSFANQPIRVLLQKTVGTGEDNTTAEWVTLMGQSQSIVSGHNKITGQIKPSEGWDSEAFYTATLGYKLNDNDTPITFVDPQGLTTMTGQGAYLDASPMRIVDSNNQDSQCVLTQGNPQTCDLVANGSEVRLTGVNVWQDADHPQTIDVNGNHKQMLTGGHVTTDVPFDIETTGQKTFKWNNVTTVVTYNTDTRQIVVEDIDPVNNVVYDNAYINGAVTKITNKGNRSDIREARNTGIRLALDTLDQSAISGLESVTWSAEYPLVEFVKVYAPDLPSLVEEGLKLVEKTINNNILANAVEFSEDGQFYLDVATVNDGITDAIANLGSQYEKYFPRFANVVLPLDLVAHYRVHGVDKVKSKRFNIAIGDRGKRIINFTGNGTTQCLTNMGGKFAFQDCNASKVVNENTDPNVLFKFVPAALGTVTHPTNVFQVRPFSDDTQCLTVNGYNVTAERCDVDYGVSQLFSFKAQSDQHLEESIVTSGNTSEMTIASLKNGRVFDRSGGGAGGSVWGDLIVYPKNGDKGSINQHMFVSRFGVQDSNKPKTVPVDLTMRCQTGKELFGYWSTISLTATNNSDYDAYVRINWNERWELVRAGTTRKVDQRRMSMPVAFDQVYRFFTEFNPHNAFFSLPANETACETGYGRPALDFTETKKGYNAWTELPE
ncbi:TPA: hypothetical protein ACOJPH_002599 [Vibrio campbellii]|uniref:hypothetical protein n=1 Tax=Vibrio campbellii TaxID=680 RepID=UPI00390A4EA6